MTPRKTFASVGLVIDHPYVDIALDHFVRDIEDVIDAMDNGDLDTVVGYDDNTPALLRELLDAVYTARSLSSPQHRITDYRKAPQ